MKAILLYRCPFVSYEQGVVQLYDSLAINVSQKLYKHYSAEADPRGGAVGARPPLKSFNLVFLLHQCMVKSFNLVFLLHGMHACSARLTFDQRTVYVLSTARVSRSVSSARGMRDSGSIDLKLFFFLFLFPTEAGPVLAVVLY